MKRILINSSYGDELRVALVDGAKLYDFDTESPDKVLLKGSIFKATVSRVESSLDAAFVNFGSERHGFLPLKDLSNDFFKKNSEGRKECTLERRSRNNCSSNKRGKRNQRRSSYNTNRIGRKVYCTYSKLIKIWWNIKKNKWRRKRSNQASLDSIISQII